MAETFKRACAAVLVAPVAVLAAACGDDGGDDDRQVVIDHVKASTAEDGIDLTDEEADCMVDVASSYADIPTLADAARQGEAEFEAVLLDEEETSLALDVMSKCPDLADKLAEAVAGESGG